MKNSLLILFIILLLWTVTSCENPFTDDSQSENQPPNNSAIITGTVTNVNSRIEMIADETEITSGPYSVIINENTDFYFADGSAANFADVESGQKVEITFNGQVMLSYPAQIVAHKVVIK